MTRFSFTLTRRVAAWTIAAVAVIFIWAPGAWSQG